MIELPEDTKIDFILDKGQQKEVFISLRYIVDAKQTITFYTYYALGSAVITAKLHLADK